MAALFTVPVSKIIPRGLTDVRQKDKDVTKINQQEVRWHLAQMFSYLELNREEKMAVAKILCSWIDSEKSKIVIVNSLQTMAEFAREEQDMRPVAIKNSSISSKIVNFVKSGRSTGNSAGGMIHLNAIRNWKEILSLSGKTLAFSDPGLWSCSWAALIISIIVGPFWDRPLIYPSGHRIFHLSPMFLLLRNRLPPPRLF